MTQICKYMDDIHERARAATKERPLRLAVASAGEAHVLAAVGRAVAAGYVEAVLFGDQAQTEELADAAALDVAQATLHHAETPLEAGRLAVQAVSSGACDLLMKGYIRTSLLMREVLNKEYGLRGPGKLSHVLVIDAPHYDKLYLMSDGALNIDPDLSLKLEIVNNAVALAHALGIELPKVALLAAIETVDMAQPSSVDMAIIAKMADRGQIKGALVDGPLALDNAINAHAAKVKRIKSEVAGDADVLIVDNIDVGNVFYKSLVFFASANVAGIVTGGSAPIILTSRADSTETKFNSVALGCALAAQGVSG